MGNFASVFIQTSFNNHAVCLDCCVGGGTVWVARPERLWFCVADKKFENSCPKKRTLIRRVWKQSAEKKVSTERWDNYGVVKWHSLPCTGQQIQIKLITARRVRWLLMSLDQQWQLYKAVSPQRLVIILYLQSCGGTLPHSDSRQS